MVNLIPHQLLSTYLKVRATRYFVQAFQRFLLNWHIRNGRHELPWRQTTDPYKILVSELMLQQTQVERVIPKYLAFLQRFPDVSSLAETSLSEVLNLWQGLGYNRRARFLHLTAQAIQNEHQGQFPHSAQELLALPGIGPYTASAVQAFAFDAPVTLIETNVRAVFIYHFFPLETNVADAEIIPLLEDAQEGTSSRVFYAALMDYGSHLKKMLPNPSRRSKHHTTQSQFAGSLRQMRGAIIRQLLLEHPVKKKTLLSYTVPAARAEHFEQALQQLIAEKLVLEHGDTIDLAN